ncbi:MAG: hypothetical protein WED04_12165 [Promethearchaeati archaeon SRVP18_Atabeyarchaeia-1]
MSMADISWAAPLISALLMLSVGVLVLARYARNRMRESLYWGVGLISYGSSHLIEFGYSSSLIVQTSLTYFLRQTLVVTMLVFFFAGCTLTIIRRKGIRASLALLFFVVQEVLIYYFDLVVNDLTLSSTVHIIYFVIPFSIFFVAFFLVYYFSSKRTGSLLIALGWTSYAVIVPFYFLWRGTALLPFWFVLRSASLVPLLIGFALLAYTGTTKSR